MLKRLKGTEIKSNNSKKHDTTNLVLSKNLITCNFLFLTQIYRWVMHQFIYEPAYSNALSIALLMLKKSCSISLIDSSKSCKVSTKCF